MAHYPVNVGTPIYCCVFVGPDTILLGGGGGSSKSGVTNKISILKLNPELKKADVVEDYRLTNGEDAPMSVDFDPTARQVICGINSSPADLKAGKNQHLRMFALSDAHKLAPNGAQQTLVSTDEDDYQRVTCLSSGKPKLLAVGGTSNQLDILTYPGYKPAFNSLRCDEQHKQNQLLTVDFNETGSQLLVCSSLFVQMFSTTRPSSKKKKKRAPQATLIRQIDTPIPPSGFVGSFRTAKYGRGSNSKLVYTIVNHVPLSRPGSHKKAKGANRPPVLTCWDSGDGKRRRTKNLSTRPATAFDVSPGGEFLAYSSSDLSIGILDATSLRSLLSILHAHEFPVTCIRFSPDSNLAVSCSADMSMRVIEVPKRAVGWSSATLLILIAFITLSISIMAQLVLSRSNWIIPYMKERNAEMT